jgi:hypothetical protein
MGFHRRWDKGFAAIELQWADARESLSAVFMENEMVNPS